MKATLEQVAEEALSLSLSDRSALTRILIQTLDSEPDEDRVEVEHAWQAEAEKPVDECQSGSHLHIQQLNRSCSTWLLRSRCSNRLTVIDTVP